jgi:hypothetical protein
MQPARRARKEQPLSTVRNIRPPQDEGWGPPSAAVLLYAKIVGLPAGYIEAYLGDFTDMYAEEMERIPQASRRPPDFRTGCEVMRHVAFAVEEPHLQRSFACLLATASDVRNGDKAHPSFASILTGLTPVETGMLLALNASFPRFQPSGTEIERLRAHLRAGSADCITAGLSNLQRLGLLEGAPGDANGRLAISVFGRRFLYACLSCSG